MDGTSPVVSSPMTILLNFSEVQVCAVSLHLDQVSLMAVSCGQSVHATVHELLRCTDSRTVARARSAQIPAGHEAAVHNNSHSVNTAQRYTC